MANRLDKLIGYISPARGARRASARLAMNHLGGMQSQVSSHRAARRNRLTDDWLTSRGSADADILNDLPNIRMRSREVVKNTGLGEGLIGSLADTLVGTGIRPQSTIDHQELGISEEDARSIGSSMERAFRRWVPFADAHGRCLSFWALEKLITRSWLESGDVFLHPTFLDREGKGSRPRTYSFALEAIEADRVCTPHGRAGNDDTGNEIRDGVEIDSRGTPVAYWVRASHPGDIMISGLAKHDRGTFKRVPAWTESGRPGMIHIFEPLRVGQTRGIPLLAPILVDIHQLDEYLMNELTVKRVLSCIGLIVENPELADGSVIGTYESEDGSETGPGSRNTKFKPGMVFEGQRGQKLSAFNPARDDQTFDPFVMVMLRRIACGAKTTYEFLTKDFSKSNFANGKLSETHLWKTLSSDQRFLGGSMVTPSYMFVAEESYLRNEYALPEQLTPLSSLDWFAATTHAPGRSYMQPEKEIPAIGDAIEIGVSNRAIACGERGLDWETVARQQAREQALDKSLGIQRGPIPVRATNDRDDDEARGVA